MPATLTDIARFTTDGVVVTSPASATVSAVIRAADPTARDIGDTEIPMFFNLASDAQAMLDEKFAVVSTINPLHEAAEVEESLGLGRSIAITPAVPRFRVLDATRDIDGLARVRAYSYNMGSERYSVELLG